MNPVLPLPLLIPLLLAVVGLGSWLSWKSTVNTRSGTRRSLMVIRVLSLLAISAFLLNPGHWQSLQDEAQKVWVTLIDDSQSMSIDRRANEASELSQKIAQHGEQETLSTRTFTYGDQLAEQSDLESKGSRSDLSTAADMLLSQLSARGETPAGVIVLSDGRQTHTPRHSNFSLRAQALGVPFFTVPVGGQHATRDLALHAPRKTITVFPNQNVQVTLALESQNLELLETDLTLSNESGEELAMAKVSVKADEQSFYTFSLPSPAVSSTWTVRVPRHPDELRFSNNETQIHVRVLKNKARIFLAEGAPYWDSKFLAQLLRQQEFMEVHSVHRLSDTRFFRIDSGESKPSQSDTDLFPDTLEKLQAYDLIIFGKNSEHFITSERAAHLRTFVKDQGGAVLFARSKPYSGKLPALEPLEPVAWATGLSSDFSLRPSPDGQAAGLFGQALPAPDSPVWQSLPKLKDAHRIDIVKPFTRVLAHGVSSSQSLSDQFPLLLVRRYGQGVSGLVNADGLWKWDFFPEARELGNMYQEYWIQLIYWMLSYSEFLPGQDYSLNLSATTVSSDTPIALRVAYRGKGTPEVPQLEVSSPALEASLILSPAETPSADGRLKWSTSFTPSKPGSYRIRLMVKEVEETALPQAAVTVMPPPAEMDELSADPDFLTRFAAATGGKSILISEFDSFLKDTVKKQSPQARDQGITWKPSWMLWFLPILLTALLATEWFLRRRNGLI